MEGAIRAFIKRFYLYTTLVEYCIIIPIAVIAIALSTDIPAQQLYSILIIIGIVAFTALVVFPPVQKYMFKPFMQMADALKEGMETDAHVKILMRERLFALPVMRAFIGILFWLSSIIVVVGGMWVVHIDIETILVCFVVGACILIAVSFAMILVPQILINKFIASNDFVKDLLSFAQQKNISFWGSLKNALTVSISVMILLSILFIASTTLLYVFKTRIDEYSQQMRINAVAVANDMKSFLHTGLELASVAALEGDINTLGYLKGRDEIIDVFIIKDERNATVLRSLTGKVVNLKADALGMADGMKKKKSFIGNFVFIPELKKSVVVCAVKNNNQLYCIGYDVNVLFQQKFMHYKIGERGYILITDKNGLFLAHPKAEYIGVENLNKYDWGKEAL